MPPSGASTRGVSPTCVDPPRRCSRRPGSVSPWECSSPRGTGRYPARDYGTPRERAWRAVATGIAIAGHEAAPGSSIGRALAEAGFPLGRIRGLLADRAPDPARWTFEVASFLASRRKVPDWGLWAAILLAGPARRDALITRLRRDYLANLAG